jgi:hypothetical protein
MPHPTAAAASNFLDPKSAMDELKKYTRGDGLSAKELVRLLSHSFSPHFKEERVCEGRY